LRTTFKRLPQLRGDQAPVSTHSFGGRGKLIGSASKWSALQVESVGNDFISQVLKKREQRLQRGVLGSFKAGFFGDADNKASDGRIANYTSEEIRINATKSLSLLLSRVAKNSALMPIYLNLKQDIDAAEKRKKTKIMYLVAGIAAFIFLDIVIVIATSYGNH
jgi:hypothetical protein